MPTQLHLMSLILLTVGLNTVAQTLLKLGSGKSPLNVFTLGGIFAYGLSTILYIFVLGKLNLSLAYPTVIGLTVIATTIAGSVLLREEVFTVQWMGVGLMISGVFAIAVGKSLS